MNKFIGVSIFLFSITNPLMAFAMFEEDPVTPIVCPKEINCAHDNSISSCKPVGDNLEYWGAINSGDWVRKGTYFFENGTAPYHSPYNYYGNEELPRCSYFQINKEGLKMTMWIQGKPGNHLEALLVTPTKWKVGGHQASCYGYSSEAIPQDPQYCPLDKVPLIEVTLNAYVLLSAYANEILLTKEPIYNTQPPATITMYQAWDGCWDSECVIDFVAQDNGASIEIGSILVDMDNKFQILDIYTLPSSGFEIVKIDEKNAIEINRM